MNPPRWTSMHIYYSGDHGLLLTDCVAPTIETLRRRRLLRSWFFVRYWLGGPHVRLRVLPDHPSTAAEVKETLERDVASFLARWPALHARDGVAIERASAGLFIAEYGAAEYRRRYGEAAEIPTVADNSYEYVDYEPEIERYGGERGVELAERHFEVSSDLVLEHLSNGNTHLRPILLGLGLRLSLTMAAAFLPDEPSMAEFLERYAAFWKQSYGEPVARVDQFVESRYERMASRLENALTMARAPQGTHARWAGHSHDLCREVQRLLRANLITLPQGYSHIPESYFLGNYMHMTNNRLGLRISDEVYLCSLLRRALDPFLRSHASA